LSLQKQRILRGESGAEADRQFHYLLAGAARNRFLLQIVDSNMKFFIESRDNVLQVDGRPEKSIQRHRELLDAIEARDPEGAAQAMREHLLDVEKSLFETEGEKAGNRKQVS
jgi:GntR family transcriptional repressor for pyruvate dehydrogenase complex